MVKMLQSILLWFYCLDMPRVILIVAIATGMFLLLLRLDSKVGLKWLLGILLICWIGAMGYATLGARNDTKITQIDLTPFHSYREVWNGGNAEIYRSNFMNAVLFYPAGLLATSLLPQKWPGWCRCLLVVLALTAMSAGIEFLQYCYCLGRCEIDDVIHNTAGALLGSLAATVSSAIGSRRSCAPSKNVKTR